MGDHVGMDIRMLIVEQAAGLFDAAVPQLQPLAGGHFAWTYEWTRDAQSYVLRVAPPDSEMDLQATRALHEWLAYLAAHDAPVVRPLRSRAGNVIEPIVYDGRTYLASAYTKAPGVRAETLPLERWDAALLQRLGRAVGRCHAIARGYVPPSQALTRREWDQATNCFHPANDLAAADDFVHEQRARVMGIIQALPKDEESYGLAHLDLHLANCLVAPDQGGIVLLDFDDCAYGWYVMDLAMLVFDMLVVYGAERGRERLGERVLAELVTGYRAEKALSDFWIGQLPHFLKLVEIGVYAMLAKRYDPVATEDTWVAAFMRDREQRIRAGIPYMEAGTAL